MRIVCFLLGLVLLLKGVSWLYRPRNNTKEAGMDYVRAYSYLAEPSDGLDVFFVGTSLFYAGFAPLQLFAENGVTSYDLAIGGQTANITDQCVRNALRTHHPKVIVVDALALVSNMEFQDCLFSELERHFPILTYHENWKVLGMEQLLSPARYTVSEPEKGHVTRAKSARFDTEGYMEPSDGYIPLPLLNKLYLRRIAGMCKREGVALVVLSLPSPKNWNISRHRKTALYTQALGLPFLDLNLMTDEIGMDFDTDFRDEGDHLNETGAARVSRYVARYLQREYGLTDHRSDPAFALWHEQCRAVGIDLPA